MREEYTSYTAQFGVLKEDVDNIDTLPSCNAIFLSLAAINSSSHESKEQATLLVSTSESFTESTKVSGVALPVMEYSNAMSEESVTIVWATRVSESAVPSDTSLGRKRSPKDTPHSLQDFKNLIMFEFSSGPGRSAELICSVFINLVSTCLELGECGDMDQSKDLLTQNIAIPQCLSENRSLFH